MFSLKNLTLNRVAIGCFGVFGTDRILALGEIMANTEGAVIATWVWTAAVCGVLLAENEGWRR